MDYIIEDTFENTKIAILKCDENTPYPKAHMDLLMSRYVKYEAYNSYMDKNRDNPHIRIVIKGINNCQWIRLTSSEDGLPLMGYYFNGTKIKTILFFVPPYQDNPIKKLDKLASKCIEKDPSCRQFIDTYMDDPFVRVIVRHFDKLGFVPFDNQSL